MGLASKIQHLLIPVTLGGSRVALELSGRVSFKSQRPLGQQNIDICREIPVSSKYCNGPSLMQLPDLTLGQPVGLRAGCLWNLLC